jgi:hypothetical protein
VSIFSAVDPQRFLRPIGLSDSGNRGSPVPQGVAGIDERRASPALIEVRWQIPVSFNGAQFQRAQTK